MSASSWWNRARPGSTATMMCCPGAIVLVLDATWASATLEDGRHAWLSQQGLDAVLVSHWRLSCCEPVPVEAAKMGESVLAASSRQ